MAGRWDSEFAHESWAVDPLDMLSPDDFEALLVNRYGQDYVSGPWDYKRADDGAFLPVRDWDARIFDLVKQHPDGLTKYQIKLATGASYGVIYRVVREPSFVVAGVVKANRGYAELWRLNKEKV